MSPCEAELIQQLEQALRLNAGLQRENQLLREKVNLLLRRVFGASSEKLDAAQLQLLLSGVELVQPAAEQQTQASKSKAPVQPPRKAKQPRLPQNLPVVEEVIDPEPVKAAPEQFRQIGQEVSEQLDYEPARYFRRRVVRRTYVSKTEPENAPITASLPPTLQERCIATPALLAHIIVSKYCDHLPLYRQEQILARRHGINLPRQTLARWMELAAQWLVQVYLPTERYITDNDRIVFFERVFQQLASVPGVRAVGGTSSFPIYAPTFFRPFNIVGGEGTTTDLSLEADINSTTPSYLALMGIRLSEGRYFTEADREGSEGVAIVDEIFKRRFLRDKPAIGTVLSVDADSGIRKTLTIVGVARGVINVGNQYELGQPRPIVYVPFGQFAPTTMTILAKADGLPASLSPALRQTLRGLDHDLPVQDIRPVEDRIHEAGNRGRQMVGVLGIFAASALILCAVGIFGVVALSVVQRTREIGIRMALGAQASNVQLMFLRQGLILTTAGIGLGAIGALLLTRQIQSLLYGISPNDLLTYTGAAVVVALVALSATYLPSRRAALVDPALALRSE